MHAHQRQELLKIVRNLPLFAGLSEPAFGLLENDIRFNSFVRGHTLFCQDDPATLFYIVLDGWVKVYRTTAGGEEAIIDVFTRGQSFAEIAALAGHDYPANATLVTDAHLAVISTNAIIRSISSDPAVATAMLSSVSRHVHRLVDEIEGMKGHSGLQRLAEFLVELSPVDTGSSMVRLPYEKSVIATRLGMKAESLSRLFQRLRSHGVVVKQDMAIINDISVLRAAVENDELSSLPKQR
jgi:CRP-like cAMP-binding protein